MKVTTSLIITLVLVIVACEADPLVKTRSFAGNVENVIQASEGNALEETLIRKMNIKCSQNDMSSCLMLKLVTYMNGMLKKAAIQLADDVEITRNSQNTEMTNDEELARAGASDDEQVTQLLLNKLWTFVRTRSLKWKMLEEAELVVSNKPQADGSMNIGMAIRSPGDVGDGRGKMKNLAPFLAAAAMKIGILGGLAFKGIALLVGKALLVSKIALLLASIIGLKKLFSHQKHVTYEVVAHPHHTHESSGGHESYNSEWGRESGRSEQSAQDMAYFAQKPKEIVEEIPTVVQDTAAEKVDVQN